MHQIAKLATALLDRMFHHRSNKCRHEQEQVQKTMSTRMTQSVKSSQLQPPDPSPVLTKTNSDFCELEIEVRVRTTQE